MEWYIFPAVKIIRSPLNGSQCRDIEPVLERLIDQTACSMTVLIPVASGGGMIQKKITRGLLKKDSRAMFYRCLDDYCFRIRSMIAVASSMLTGTLPVGVPLNR